MQLKIQKDEARQIGLGKAEPADQEHNILQNRLAVVSNENLKVD